MPVSVSVSVSENDESSKPRFHHEKLDVYQRAIDLVVITDRIAGDLNRGRGYLADQLRRASTSIPLNIAEGAGEFSKKEKARIYRIARRSATECAAILDICSQLRLVETPDAEEARVLLHRIISMLTRLTQTRTNSDRINAPEY